MEVTDRAEMVVDDPNLPPDADRCVPAVSPRKPGGAISKFDEIVTPHPVVAFLFRRRTFIVLLGVVPLVPLAQPRPWMMTVGLLMALAGESLRIWAAGTLHKTEELTTGGPYACIRHPLYVGSFLLAVALGFMSGRWESFFYLVPLFLILYSAAVATEEAMLHKLFGERYETYCRRVPRFLPRLRGSERGYGRFAWRQVLLNKEYVNVIWAIVLSGLFLARLLGGS